MNANEYKALRHAIQLQEPCVKTLNMHYPDTQKKIKGEVSTNISISYKTSSIDATTITGFCTLDVKFSTPETEDLLSILVEAYSDFKNEGQLSYDEFQSGVKNLCVPLLLPFIKANTIILTSMLKIPPLDIPTIDILKSISANKE